MLRTPSRDTVLQCSSDVHVHVRAVGDVRIRHGGREVAAASHGLAILSAFRVPKVLSVALEELRPCVSGVQCWMELVDTIRAMTEIGILNTPGSSRALVAPGEYGFDAAAVHIEMLNDRARTASFLAGIEEQVKPGDVVVDIGTGTGVLAMAAARAGARQVYAIETTRIGGVARELFYANGMAERISLIQGRSTEIELPERADVLVSEIIGNEPLGEQVLETFADAQKRLLKRGARTIPRVLRVYGLPVHIPGTVLSRYTFVDDRIRQWRSWYGIGFDKLQDAFPSVPQYFVIGPQKTKDWQQLADPMPLLKIDFTQMPDLRVENTVRSLAAMDGKWNGLLVYFELELSPGRVLSTHPASATDENSWRSFVWYRTNALQIKTGDILSATYRYRVPNKPMVEWERTFLAGGAHEHAPEIVTG